MGSGETQLAWALVPSSSPGGFAANPPLRAAKTPWHGVTCQAILGAVGLAAVGASCDGGRLADNRRCGDVRLQDIRDDARRCRSPPTSRVRVTAARVATRRIGSRQ